MNDALAAETDRLRRKFVRQRFRDRLLYFARLVGWSIVFSFWAAFVGAVVAMILHFVIKYW